MASERQLRAARENGRKSKGPVTADGKRYSSRNAITHGLLADNILLDSEDRLRFDVFYHGMFAHLEPNGPVETALVETMIVSRWRQMRLWSIEKFNLEQAIEQQSSPNPPVRAALAFRSLCDGSTSLEVLNRYETRYDRLYSRALARLNALRKRRQQETLILPNEPEFDATEDAVDPAC